MIRNHQNLTLLFWHRKSKADNEGLAPVICRISIDGEPEEELSTGKKVRVKHWNLEDKKVTGCKEAKEINLRINEMTVDLNRHFIVLQTQYARISPLMLKNVYQGKPPGEGKKKVIKKPVRELAPVPTLLQAADKHIANFAKMVDKKLRSGEPLKQWRSTRKKIEEFILFEYQCCDIDLPDIEFSFAAKFYNYLTIDREKVIGDAAAKK